MVPSSPLPSSVLLLGARRVAPEPLSKVTGCVVWLQVMYFSSLFPYLVLICFLVRALLLEGSMAGIRHMFTPKVSVRLRFLRKRSQSF